MSLERLNNLTLLFTEEINCLFSLFLLSTQLICAIVFELLCSLPIGNYDHNTTDQRKFLFEIIE